MALTNREIDAAKLDAKAYRLSDGKGLVLQVTPNGSKLWRMRYRYGGTEKMLSLGRYPEVRFYPVLTDTTKRVHTAPKRSVHDY